MLESLLCYDLRCEKISMFLYGTLILVCELSGCVLLMRRSVKCGGMYEQCGAFHYSGKRLSGVVKEERI